MRFLSFLRLCLVLGLFIFVTGFGLTNLYAAECAIDDDCEDGLSCTTHVCSGGACINTDTCNDGLYCNGVELCNPTDPSADGSGCVVGDDPCPDDGPSCTTTSCSEATDSCVVDRFDSRCDDELYCNGEETCEPGDPAANTTTGCLAGLDVVCDDSFQCTTDSCNEATNSCFNEPVNSVCDDGLYCNGDEVCNPQGDSPDEFGCIAGTEKICADSLFCTDDSCNEDIDACQYLDNDDNCDLGNDCKIYGACNSSDFSTYTNGGCYQAVNKDDGTVCALGKALSGLCLSGQCLDIDCLTDAECDDNVACTTDTCGIDRQCSNVASNSYCNDNLYCNGVETCNDTPSVVPIEGCVAGVAIDCDDAIACTDDSCNEDSDLCEHVNNDDNCSNNLYCDGPELCDPANGSADANGCVASSGNVDCDDLVGCTIDSCDENGDACLNDPDHSSCDDGNECTTDTCDLTNGCTNTNVADGTDCVVPGKAVFDGKCISGVCELFCTLDSQCDDGLSCTADTCAAGGYCENTPVNSSCNDNNVCNGVEVCNPDDPQAVAGTGCVAGTDLVCASDGDPCTDDTACDAVSGCTYDLMADGLECEINPEILEVCISGNCVEGCTSNNQCDDGFDCTLDVCNQAISYCEYTSRDSECLDANPCDGAETCDPDNPENNPATGCVAGVPLVCSDGEYCNGTEVCQAFVGCVDGTAPNCDDSVGCTDDSCNEQSDSCDNIADDGNCADLGPCIVGLCNATSDCYTSQLANGTACDVIPEVAETCQEGVCLATCNTDEDCDDGLACTVDTCNESNLCESAPDDSLCSDSNVCNGVETCDPENAEADANGCVVAEDLNCDDGFTCTTDSCDPQAGCINEADNTVCADGAYCNGVEVCAVDDPAADANGCIGGVLVDCDDGMECSNNYCDENSDSCAVILDNDLCNDNLFCNGTESCNPTGAGHDARGCVSGSVPCSADNFDCTTDGCDEATDICTHVPNDALCANDSYCDGVETCSVTQGCIAGSAVDCNDDVACTVDSCDDTQDICVNAPNNTLCQDNIFCNGEEVCNVLLGCVDGTPEECDDGIDCTSDSCNPLFDVCYNIPQNDFCDDSAFCNGEEICVAGSGCQTQDVPDCSVGGNECTDNSCNEATDSCDHIPNDANCDNNLYCDGAETCDLLLGCREATDIDCSDDVSCTVDSCDEDNDECSQLADDSLCDDGGPCKDLVGCNVESGCEYTNHPDDEVCDVLPALDETCQNGLCVPDCQTNADCNDDVPCTNDTCDEGGHCVNEPLDEICDNGIFCDGTEVCDTTLGCVAGPDFTCDDGFECTADDCDEENNICTHLANNAVCDDADWCTGDAVCNPEDVTADSQGCVADVPRCDDGVACTNDLCNGQEQTCTNEPVDTNCDDGLYCTGVEVCNPDSLSADLNGCVAGEDVVCDDNFACTTDLCDEDQDVCVYDKSKTFCDNEQYCDGLEICDPANESSDLDGCVAGKDPCLDNFACTNDTCNEELDSCLNLADNGNCSDDLFCTGEEICDPGNASADAAGCVVGSDPCVDQFGCTNDFCNEGNDSCLFENDDSKCSDNLFCSGVETCNPDDSSADAMGCVAGSDPCIDDYACTDDNCDEQNDQCSNDANNANCDDALFCNGAEVCDPDNGASDVAGCVAGEDPCLDQVACTSDSCDESSDACLHTPDDALCDNEVFCDGVEVCNENSGCEAGALPDCDDAIDCTTDSCDATLDQCANTANDTFCDDEKYCNGSESCDLNQGCISDGNPPDCDDDVACTEDSCSDASASCVNTPLDSRCDDGLFCNGSESCDTTLGCQQGEKPACDDQIECTADSCNEDDDSCLHLADNSLCDDGLFCSGEEICSLETGCETLSRDCDDALECTVDSCDEENDVCQNTPDDTVCDDSNPCTEPDECSDTGCTTSNVADDTACDVDSTKDETCQNGVCVADCQLDTDCNDDFDCTSDSCNSDGHCEYLTDDAVCNLGRNFCDPIAACVVGEGCIELDPPDCDDGIDCTVDICSDSLESCVNEPNDESCDDFEPCTDDSCDAVSGCMNSKVADNTPCGAGNDYICLDGVCQPPVVDGDTDMDDEIEVDGDLDQLEEELEPEVEIDDDEAEVEVIDGDEDKVDPDGDLETIDGDEDDILPDGDDEPVVDGDEDTVEPDGDREDDDTNGGGGGCNSSNANLPMMLLLLLSLSFVLRRRVL